MRKYNKAFVLLMIAILTLLMMPSCEKPPQNLEEYLGRNEETSSRIDKIVSDTDIDEFYVKENNVTYVCDITKHETTKDIDEETAKSDVIIKNLDKALEETSDTFTGMCESLESESQIEGITITIIYRYGEDELLSKTFDSTGTVKDTADDSGDADTGDSADDAGESDSDSASDTDN